MAEVKNADTTEETKPTPIFGSGTAFGAGGGFAAVTGGFSSISTEPTGGAEDGEDGAAPEEECQAEFKPVVQLEEVETTTGEEAEDTLLEMKCKLYRFDTGNNEWKERGIGLVRLLQHKENMRVRLLMRQEKTLKIRANHLVMPNTKLQEHAGSDKAWVWSTVDFADGAQKVELFCIRFGTPEKATEFKSKFEEAAAINEQQLGGAAVTVSGNKEDKVASELAKEVEEKATVEEGEEVTSKRQE